MIVAMNANIDLKQASCTMLWDEFVAQSHHQNRAPLNALIEQANYDDLFTLIYT